MNDDCPVCGLDFDRGEPGYFTGAMYVSYALAIPLDRAANLDRIPDHPGLVALPAGRCWPRSLCVPLIPWIWQYSRVIWIHFDQLLRPGMTSRASPVDAAAELEDRHRGMSSIPMAHVPDALRPIAEVAARPGHRRRAPRALRPRQGQGPARGPATRPSRPPGKLILVSAITPTPAGEGKTTTSIGLAQGLRKIGKNGGPGAAAAVDGAGLRPQGGGDRRRRQPARAVEHDQPPVHRRLPRDHRRPQPAGRGDRQPAPLRRHRRSTPAASSGSGPST